MKTKPQARKIVELLETEYPDARCSLDYGKDYEFLFAVRLSAQCTDARVNLVTPALFSAFPTLQSFADADREKLEALIRPCGFFRSKAGDIIDCARALLEKHDGRVPGTMEELLDLPGVGRKTRPCSGSFQSLRRSMCRAGRSSRRWRRFSWAGLSSRQSRRSSSSPQRGWCAEESFERCLHRLPPTVSMRAMYSSCSLRGMSFQRMFQPATRT